MRKIILIGLCMFFIVGCNKPTDNISEKPECYLVRASIPNFDGCYNGGCSLLAEYSSPTYHGTDCLEITNKTDIAIIEYIEFHNKLFENESLEFTVYGHESLSLDCSVLDQLKRCTPDFSHPNNQR